MKPITGLSFLVLVSLYLGVKAKCGKGCDLALASYYVPRGSTLSTIGNLFGIDADTIVNYNKAHIPNKDVVQYGTIINIPFSCACVEDKLDEFLGHMFDYDVVSGDTYGLIGEHYSNLTTIQLLQSSNSYDPNNIPNVNAKVNVTVKCFCGDTAISKKYGLFITYPLRSEDNLDSISQNTGLDKQLLQSYNVGRDFSNGSGLVFIPGKDLNGTYPPLKSSSGLTGGVITGLSVAAIAGVLALAVCVYLTFYQKKKIEKILLAASEDQSSHSGLDKDTEVTAPPAGGITGITVDKSVEFSYEELAKATDDFSIANKIGQGGFGSVYYAVLRGEQAAIKKMDMQASREFLAELKVLTRVHHLNLVRLIGYCVEGSLFLVYEYIENGNLSQHLRGAGREPLTWSSRVQIALDSARALEYIHEHTFPVYIHRDIKPANILIDKNFHGKVADFGLTKLAEVGSSPIPTRLVGTFGYMPPDYAQYGEVSPKIDVFAFGVVLYELISAKEAVVKADSSVSESKGLIALFEDILNEPHTRDDLCKLIDPRLEDNYPLDAVYKVAKLAEACTHENPKVRPSMRSIVVALMAISPSTEDWDVGSFHDVKFGPNFISKLML